jgi:hypothetical protein
LVVTAGEVLPVFRTHVLNAAGDLLSVRAEGASAKPDEDGPGGTQYKLSLKLQQQKIRFAAEPEEDESGASIFRGVKPPVTAGHYEMIFVLTGPNIVPLQKVFKLVIEPAAPHELALTADDSVLVKWL